MSKLQTAFAQHPAAPTIATDDPLFTPEQAASYIGVTGATLSIWRCTKRYNLAYIKVGRLVRYRKSACDAFLQARTIEG